MNNMSVTIIVFTLLLLISSVLIYGLVYSIMYYTDSFWLGFLVVALSATAVAVVAWNFIVAYWERQGNE